MVWNSMLPSHIPHQTVPGQLSKIESIPCHSLPGLAKLEVHTSAATAFPKIVRPSGKKACRPPLARIGQRPAPLPTANPWRQRRELAAALQEFLSQLFAVALLLPAGASTLASFPRRRKNGMPLMTMGFCPGSGDLTGRSEDGIQAAWVHEYEILTPGCRAGRAGCRPLDEKSTPSRPRTRCPNKQWAPSFRLWQNQSSVGLIWSPETLPNGFEYQKQGSTVGASDDNWHSSVEFGRGCRP